MFFFLTDCSPHRVRGPGRVLNEGGAMQSGADMTAAGAADDQHQAMLEMLQRKWRSRQLAIPTNDRLVMLRLRELHEPIALFGEGPEDRRDRLRDVLARLGSDQAMPTALLRTDDSDDSAMSDDGSSSEDEDESVSVMHDTGSAELLAMRRWLAVDSLARARARLAAERERVRAQEAEEAAAKEAAKEGVQGAEDSTSSASANTTSAAARTTTKTRRMTERQAAVREWTSVLSQIGDERPLSACALARDGKTAVTGAWGGAVTFWATADGSVRARTAGHADRVVGVAISPVPVPMSNGATSGVLAASCTAAGDVSLWMAGRTEAVRTHAGAHAGRANRVAFHPTGRLLASTGDDGRWRLWDVETGAALAAQRGHARAVFGVAFQRDGGLALTASVDTTARAWDLRTGRCVATLRGHARDVVACAWSPNGHTCATAGDDNAVRVWDLRTQACAACIPAHPKLISTLCFDVCFGPSHFHLISSFSLFITFHSWLCSHACLFIHNTTKHTQTERQRRCSCKWII